MKNLLYIEWQKLKWPIIISLVVGTVIAAFLTTSIYKGYALEEQLEVWEVGFSFINFIFPIIAVVPTCWLLYFERKNGYLKYTMPRVGKKKYLLAKWIVVSGSSFITMFVMSFSSIIIALYMVSPIDVIYTLVDPSTGEVGPRMMQTHIAPELFTQQPLLYGLLLSLWKGFLSLIMATMGFVFSLYSQNLFVILTGPFIYSILENFTLSILKLEKYRLVTAFEPTLLMVDVISIGSFIVGPVIAIMTCGIYILYKKYKQKEHIYVM